jgi:hypothetical protein
MNRKPLEKRRRGVTKNDLERAACRFVADVDAMVARSNDCAQPMIAELALITLGRHMDHHAVARSLTGGKAMGRVLPRRKTPKVADPRQPERCDVVVRPSGTNQAQPHRPGPSWSGFLASPTKFNCLITSE